jgi:hypothetical protein
VVRKGPRTRFGTVAKRTDVPSEAISTFVDSPNPEE